MSRYIAIAIALLLVAFVPLSYRSAAVKIGSKKFTESVILGELVTQLARDAGSTAAHYQELGGTRLVWNALRNGEIDVYPDYTGTIRQEILAGKDVASDQSLRDALTAQGVLMSRPLGFNNTYAFGMKAERASELAIATMSDLARHPDLKFGFSSEWMERKNDGWRSLSERYGLAPLQPPRGMDHDLAYRQMDTGAIDVIDVYTTDAKIKVFDIQLLTDNREFFPRYDAVILYRADLADRHPQVVQAILRLEERLTDIGMTQMNARAELGRAAKEAAVSEQRVAADFLQDQFQITNDVQEESLASSVMKHSIEHLDLVRKSLIPAILIAIPLGIFAARYKTAGQAILAVVGVVQTIPALALLVMLMEPVSWAGLDSIGTGSVNAVLALFLYSLLPIVRNTCAGLQEISPAIRESSRALGLPSAARLRLIELPLASRTILAGIKTAAVMNVGFATLGALVGAGGYGQPILTGIRLTDNALIMQGAVAAAVMALLVQGLCELAEKLLVPRGLRLQAK